MPEISFFFLLINFISIIKYFYDVFKNGRLSKIYRRLYSNASSQDRHGLLWSFFAKTYKKNIHILTHTRTHIINKNAFYSSRKKSDSCNFKLSSIKNQLIKITFQNKPKMHTWPSVDWFTWNDLKWSVSQKNIWQVF